jgi:hypothetical protein
MKSSKSLATVLILTAALLTQTGCIISQTTSYKDVERAKITFASERAGRLFYETLARMPIKDRPESRRAVVLVVFNATHRTITGPNRHFNAGVERCDSNGDGTITDEEAQIFASSVQPAPFQDSMKSPRPV